jgi:hypothetical protein
MRPLPTLFLAVLSLTALGCHHRKCEDPAPAPQGPPCYSGVVVGDACLDGVLIDVDAATPIGQAAGTLGTNVVAAVNFAYLSSLNRVGQRVYFTYRNDPSQQSPGRACPAFGTQLQVPHLVLSNLSATGCTGTTGNR